MHAIYRPDKSKQFYLAQTYLEKCIDEKEYRYYSSL